MGFQNKLRRVAGWCGIAVALLGAIAAAGWIGGVDLLAPYRPTAAPMRMNTSLCLVLAGISLWLQRDGVRRRASVALAALAAAVAGLTAIESTFGLDLHIDQLLAHDPRVSAYGTPPGRMPPPVALAALALSIALLCLGQERGRRRWPVSAWLANLVIAVSAASLLSLGLLNVQGVTRTYLFGLHTSLAFLLLAVGTLFARPEDTHI